jgi:nitrite reductase/ring-hydroxylating ferredoxin subunit
MSIALCRTDEINEGQARSFIIGEGANRRDIVVVRKAGRFLAYENSCPHEGTPLETFPDKFLNEDGTLFVCSTHGARFRIEDGYCVSGPCEGKSLHSLEVSVIGEMVSLAG